jgi:hypothetical protein
VATPLHCLDARMNTAPRPAMPARDSSLRTVSANATGRPVALALESWRTRTPWWIRCARYFRPEVHVALAGLVAVAAIALGLSYVGLTHRVHALERALCRERLVAAQRTQPLLRSLTLPADPCAAVEQWLAMTGQPSPAAPTRPAVPPSPIALTGTRGVDQPAPPAPVRLIPALFRRPPPDTR